MTAHKDTVLVVDDNLLILKLVEDKLTEAGFGVQTARNAEEALAILRVGLPDLMILDVMMPGIDGYELCRKLKSEARTASIPVMILTARADITEKVRGFEAGADDYLVKPFDPMELTLRIRALLARLRPTTTHLDEQPDGRVISVFSMRGGTGKSTMSVNLAIALARLRNIQVPLIDLALEADQDALLLNLRPRRTWSDLAALRIEDLDEDIVIGHLAGHESGVQLLAAPETPVAATLVSPKLITRVVAILRRRYRYTVVDLPSTFAETNLVTLDLSDAIVLMVTPELSSLKATRSTLEVFESLGYGPERVSLVLNWIFPKRGLPQKNIEEALGRPIDLVLSYETVGFIDAINSGVPLIVSHPNARPVAEIAKFAQSLAAGDLKDSQAQPGQPEGRGGRLRGLAGRLADQR